MGELNGLRQLYLTVEVEQRVKGDLGRTLEIRSPSGTDCDLEVPRDESVGLLLTAAPDGAWLATACSVVIPGQLVVEGGEPRGGPIKVVVGAVILGARAVVGTAAPAQGLAPRSPRGARAVAVVRAACGTAAR